MRALPLSLLLLVTGCAALDVPAQPAYLSAVAECDVRFPAVVGHFERRAYCANNALFARTTAVGGDVDSVLPISIANLEKSLEVDKGSMSPADYTAQMAQVVDNTRIVNVEARAEAQERHAAIAGAIIGGLAAAAASAALYQPPPVYYAPRVVVTTCNRWGNSTTCISQ